MDEKLRRQEDPRVTGLFSADDLLYREHYLLRYLIMLSGRTVSPDFKGICMNPTTVFRLPLLFCTGPCTYSEWFADPGFLLLMSVSAILNYH